MCFKFANSTQSEFFEVANYKSEHGFSKFKMAIQYVGQRLKN